jgi:peptidoglycan/xylan/chitin deacetylase (PgdA/CDA1 family)
VWRGNPRRKAIALTFDDGPSESTPAVLECLARHGARATFFQCGQNVGRLPEVAREVAGAGHEIGNHSHTHPKFALQSPGFIRDEFARSQEAIEGATGVAPRLLRAPYGVRWFGFGEMQANLGLLGVMWTVIGCDWKLPATEIVRRVTRAAQPGAIVCLHDGRTTQARPDVTALLEALPSIVSNLSNNGYHLETVSQLLCPTTN